MKKLDSKQRLSSLCTNCFMLVLQLRAITDYGDANILQTRVLDLLDNFEKNSLKAGYDQSKIQSVKFALVAFIDETIISSDWESKTEWAVEPLQLKLFNCFNAGEEFFLRLDQLKQTIKENLEVIEVYFQCLTLGYRGKYHLETPEKVRIIIEDLHFQLDQYLGKSTELLSPNGLPGDEIVNVVKEKIPIWVIVTTLVSICFLFYLVMSFIISSKAEEIIESINNLIT